MIYITGDIHGDFRRFNAVPYINPLPLNQKQGLL